MLKMWKRAALALAALCLATSSASATSFVTVLKADTIYQQSIASTNHHYADSTRIMNLSAVKAMRLGFFASTQHGSGLDTVAVFAVTVKWHTCGGDTLVTGTCRDSSHSMIWRPATSIVTGTAATADTLGGYVAFGALAPTNATQGGREIRVSVHAAHDLDDLGNSMSETYPLEDRGGTPFTAPYVSFKWRLIAGPAYCKYVVALLGERP